MSAPTHIFIDTGIFDEQNYNFNSSAFNAFLMAIKKQALTLVIPDPTAREIERHIEKRAEDVLKALEEAKRKAPFLSKWKKWPIKKNSFNLEWELKEIADNEWKTFLENFSVVEIGYDGVEIGSIMDWYDGKKPPFGEGKKSKEFPDAFAIASLFVYAKKQSVSIAVVSTDGDFRRACERYSELSYFPSLPAYAEALISSDKRVEQIRIAIEDDPSLIINEIKKRFEDLSFYHEESFDADISDIDVDNVELKDFKIVHIGDQDTVISFIFIVDYSAYVRIDDEDTAIVDSSEDLHMAIFEYRGTVSDSTKISAIAKCSVNKAWDKLEAIVSFDIDDDHVIVSQRPDDYFEKGE